MRRTEEENVPPWRGDVVAMVTWTYWLREFPDYQDLPKSLSSGAAPQRAVPSPGEGGGRLLAACRATPQKCSAVGVGVVYPGMIILKDILEGRKK